jgi:hypothetical protein
MRGGKMDRTSKPSTHLVGHSKARREIPMKESIHDLEEQIAMARWRREEGGDRHEG